MSLHAPASAGVDNTVLGASVRELLALGHGGEAAAGDVTGAAIISAGSEPGRYRINGVAFDGPRQDASAFETWLHHVDGRLQVDDGSPTDLYRSLNHQRFSSPGNPQVAVGVDRSIDAARQVGIPIQGIASGGDVPLGPHGLVVASDGAADSIRMLDMAPTTMALGNLGYRAPFAPEGVTAVEKSRLFGVFTDAIGGARQIVIAAR